MNPWHYIAEGNVTIGILLYCLLSLSFLPFMRAEESADYSDAEIAYDSPATGSSHSAVGLAKNARFAFDFSTRVTYHDELDQWAYRQALGIDYIKTFSSANGDWGTLIAQLYLTRIDNYRLIDN